jgi:hypothetical protein
LQLLIRATTTSLTGAGVPAFSFFADDRGQMVGKESVSADPCRLVRQVKKVGG